MPANAPKLRAHKGRAASVRCITPGAAQERMPARHTYTNSSPWRGAAST